MNRVSSVIRSIFFTSCLAFVALGASSGLVGCAAESTADEPTETAESAESDFASTEPAPSLVHNGTASVGSNLHLVTNPGGPRDLPTTESGPGSGPQPEPWKAQNADAIILVGAPRK